MPMREGSPQGPEVATISGVEVVTIPLAHYAALLDCQRQLAAARVSPERFRADVRRRIDRDPEVATFLSECLGKVLAREAYTACLERFGAQQTPSRATIARHWDRMRGR